MDDYRAEGLAPECVECGCMYADTHAEVERLDDAEQQLKAEVHRVHADWRGAVKENERLRKRLLNAVPHDHSEATSSRPSGNCRRCALEAEFRGR